MSTVQSDFDHLLSEHVALGRQYGEAQERCSRLVISQRAEIQRLDAQVVKLRAAVIVRDTSLAYTREDRIQFEAGTPGLSKRVALARHVGTLMMRIQSLLHERLDWQWRIKFPVSDPDYPIGITRKQGSSHDSTTMDNLAGLDASLIAADLVICQTGCLSHGAYWRVQDHCKRTGKPCVLTAEPDALRIVRIHKPENSAQRTALESVLAEKNMSS